MPSVVDFTLSSRARKACEISGQDGEMRAGVEDPLFNIKGASCWAGMLERSQVLKHLVIIFHTSEFEIGNVRSPGCFALYFISEAIAYFLRPHGGEQPIARTRMN